jgi:hypothetical protein
VGGPPLFASLEHTFLVLPLIAAPLALALLRWLEGDEGDSGGTFLGLARRVQPFAAAAVLASFLVPQGAAAGALVTGWLGVALMLAMGGARRAVRAPERGVLTNLNLLAAHIFLPMGAVWLLATRLGVAPRHFGPLTALLAAIHFHFSGFTLQLRAARSLLLGAGVSLLAGMGFAAVYGLGHLSLHAKPNVV